MVVARRAVVVGVATVLVVGVVERLATAADDDAPSASEVEPIRIVIRAPAHCGDGANDSGVDAAQAFLEAVKERTTRVREASKGEPARVFRVELTTSRRGAAGQLIVVDVDGGTSPARSIRGQSCAGVAAALELIVALAVDPNAQMNTNDAGAPEAGTSDASVPPDDADSEDARPPSSRVDASSAPVPTNAEGQIVIAPTPERPPPPWHDAVGAGIDFIGTGNAPVTTGAHLFVETSREKAGVLAPSLRMNAAYFETTIAPASPSTADLAWLLLSADLCPVRFDFGTNRRFAFVPCAFGEAGATRFFTGGLPADQARTRPWLSLGPIARLDVAIAGPFFAEVSGTMRIPIVRDRFVFNPGLLVYRAPAVLFGSGIDVGVRFR